MTDKEVVALMQGDTPIARARLVFSSECGRIEQACAQRSMPSIFDIRRMEFEAVRKITSVLGMELEP